MFTRNKLLIAIAMLVAGSGALAHHSFAMFDMKKEVTLKGTVTEFAWTNPHAFLHVLVEKAGGGKEEWQLELASPNNLKRRGWKSTSLKPGDAVTVVFNPLRDGTRGGSFVSATLADGTVLLSGVKPQE
jgi:hypothetical protein